MSNAFSGQADRPVCSNCGRNPADVQTTLIVNGQMERKSLCMECARNEFENTGFGGSEAFEALSNLFGSILGGPLGAVGGPVSHPEPSPESAQIIARAIEMAREENVMCDTYHLLRALLETESGREALQEHGVDDKHMKELFDHLSDGFDIGPRDPNVEAGRMTPVLSNVLQIARKRAAVERRREIEPLHLVHGLVLQKGSVVADLLHQAGARPQPPREPENGGGAAGRRPTPALDQFGRDLTAEAAEGKIDPVIGRSEEIEEAVEILSRRRKNNVVLIGEPGVGKTAIVEGLALRIVNGDVPPTLKDRRVVSLDLAGMIAGTQFRGQFEQRLQTVLDEVTGADGEILLFVDELHTVLGAGAAEGSMDMANMLKPRLARGELHMIGATTLSEFKRIERDGALARRFSPVMVEEPSVTDTIGILRGLGQTYEAHHKTMISDEAFVAAAKLSDRYMTEQFLPDKAIDLIDQACARVRMRNMQPTVESKQLETELEGSRAELEKAVADQDFLRAAELKERIEEIEQKLREIEPTPEEGEIMTVTEQDVAEVISRRTGIPIGDLLADEITRLRNLESDLHERVVGQDKAVSAVSDAIRRARAGLADSDAPVGTFAFLGPTGVGKTELAKTIAKRLFATEKALVRIDMSEYREPHTVARLIGSPPGYVGYGEGGQLTEPVRRRPYSVVLIDEIEKAHPDVTNVLLQLMDDGRLTDGEGRTVDFSNTIVIMTSNLGAGRARKRAVGFGAEAQDDGDPAESAMIEAFKGHFPPEFVNRIDEIVVFDSLGAEQVREICRKLCDEIAERLREDRGIELDVSDELVASLAEQGFDESFGARPLKRHIRRTLEKAITDVLLDGPIDTGVKLCADLGTGGEVEITVDNPAAEPAAASA